MGGVIRKDFNSKVTHLVANCTQGEKFRVAVSLGTPIMKPEWIYKAWERRNEQDFCAAVDDFRNEFKVPPFQDCILSFLGFSDEEKTNMEEMTEMQGGKYLPLGDERCTHLVVEENIIKDLPFEPSKKLYVVKQEWFWGSIQMDARAGETMYLYEKANTPELKKSVSMLSLNTPNSNRKRRRLKETLAQLSRETDVSPFPPRKRPSAEHSLSIGSLLDISNTPESSINYGDTPKSCTKSSKTPLQFLQSSQQGGKLQKSFIKLKVIMLIYWQQLFSYFKYHWKRKDNVVDVSLHQRRLRLFLVASQISLMYTLR